MVMSQQRTVRVGKSSKSPVEPCRSNNPIKNSVPEYICRAMIDSLRFRLLSIQKWRRGSNSVTPSFGCFFQFDVIRGGWDTTTASNQPIHTSRTRLKKTPGHGALALPIVKITVHFGSVSSFPCLCLSSLSPLSLSFLFLPWLSIHRRPFSPQSPWPRQSRSDRRLFCSTRPS